jgi:hypothetical protein
MTPPPHDELIDGELIELAEVVLRQADYAVERGTDDSVAYLLAEDQDNVITVTAVLTADDAQTVEPVLTRVLVDRLSDRSVESKKWDGYVIILTSTRPDDDTTEALFSLTYNLNQVRRLIRVGIEPTTAAVARGLRAVLPLSQTPVDAISTEPLAALQARLIADGLDASQVEQALLGFRSQGDRIAPSGSEADEFDEEEEDDQLISTDVEPEDEDA